jgi:hypothetical protein
MEKEAMAFAFLVDLVRAIAGGIYSLENSGGNGIPVFEFVF